MTLNFFRNLTAVLLLLLTFSPLIQAQDSAKTTLQMGRKQESRARKLEGQARIDEYQKALQIYEHIGKKWPDAKTQLHKSGLRIAAIQGRLGQAEPAIATLEKLCEASWTPAQRVRAYMAKYRVEKKLKQYANAEESLQVIVKEFSELPKDRARALVTIASLARSQKNFKKAQGIAQQCLKEFPEDWRCCLDAAQLECRILIDCQQWQNAIERLAELDSLLEERFSKHPKWEQINRSMSKMSTRKKLTPRPISDMKP